MPASRSTAPGGIGIPFGIWSSSMRRNSTSVSTVSSTNRSASAPNTSSSPSECSWLILGLLSSDRFLPVSNDHSRRLSTASQESKSWSQAPNCSGEGRPTRIQTEFLTLYYNKNPANQWPTISPIRTYSPRHGENGHSDDG